VLFETPDLCRSGSGVLGLGIGFKPPLPRRRKAFRDDPVGLRGLAERLPDKSAALEQIAEAFRALYVDEVIKKIGSELSVFEGRSAHPAKRLGFLTMRLRAPSEIWAA
jgi:hypothetical protein